MSETDHSFGGGEEYTDGAGAGDLVGALHAGLHDLAEAEAACDADDDGGGESPLHHPTAQDMSLPHQFCAQLHRLLSILSVTFEERERLQLWKTFFEDTILDVPEMERFAIDKWHRDMTTTAAGEPREPNLYALTIARDIDAVTTSGLWVFDEIDAYSLYNDEGLDAEDREKLCLHIDNLNKLSQLHALLPQDMQVAVAEALGSLDFSQGITPETTQALLQRIIGLGDAGGGDDGTDRMDRLIQWAMSMVDSLPANLQMLTSLLNDDAIREATGGADLTAMAMTMAGELAASNEILHDDVDPLTAGEMDRVGALFGSLGSIAHAFGNGGDGDGGGDGAM